MRVIHKEITAYSFAELSEKAKEKVRDWYLECRECWEFEDDCLNQLAEMFPNSDLKVEFDAYDGFFNIYGTLDLKEVYQHIKKDMTIREMKFCDWLFRDGWVPDYKLPSSRNGYCIADRQEYMWETGYDLEYHGMRDINYDALVMFDKLAGEFLSDLCSEYTKEAYDFFYEVNDDELEDWCDCNEYEFDEDGNLI